MPSKDKRKLAAIMFADVVGYSRMMASNEERTLELLKDFENICSPIISKHDGEIIKKVGDELFCEFSSAKQAVDSALEIQEAIQPYNDSRPKDFKLQVRIGIHVGDIVLRDGDVFGDGVNVASRIQPFANPGGICVSNAVRDAISSHPSYNIKSEGQQELKNIIEKHTLYKVETGFEIIDNINKKGLMNITNPLKWILLLFGIIISSAILFIKLTDNTKEPLDSYYIHFSSSENYIDNLYEKYDIDSLSTIIYPIEDSLLDIIKKECFNYSYQQFHNKNIDIFSNFNKTHSSMLDNFPSPTILPDSTDFDNGYRYYPVKEFNQMEHELRQIIPKVFIQVLVYKAKHLNTGNESIFFYSFGKIKRHGNISTFNNSWYNNDKKGEIKLIENIKNTLYNKIDRFAFSKSAFNSWIGEIIEVFPNGDVKIKLYDDSSIQSNLLLDAEIMYCLTIDGYKKWKLHGIKQQIHDIQLGIDYMDNNKSTIPDSLLNEYSQLKERLLYYNNVLDSIITNNINNPGNNWGSDKFYIIEVLDVFGKEAIGKLHRKYKPWAEIKVGHKLSIHK